MLEPLELVQTMSTEEGKRKKDSKPQEESFLLSTRCQADGAGVFRPQPLWNEQVLMSFIYTGEEC